jgi:hypothetical protein
MDKKVYRKNPKDMKEEINQTIGFIEKGPKVVSNNVDLMPTLEPLTTLGITPNKVFPAELKGNPNIEKYSETKNFAKEHPVEIGVTVKTAKLDKPSD